MNKSTALLAALSLLPVAAAQDVIVDDPQPVRRYTVELVVFAYAEDVSIGTEIFPADEVAVVEDELILGLDIEDVNALEATVPEPQPEATDMQALDPELVDPADLLPVTPWLGTVLMLEDEFTMQDIVRRLEILDAYQPLLHAGWTQLGVPEVDAQPVELIFFGEPPAGLAGSFTLYLERYLHLVVDLAFDAAADSDEALPVLEEPIITYGDARPVYEDEADEQTGRVHYRIQENRILRNGETRYFDHPKFGVIAKVNRATEAQEDTDTTVETEDLASRLR
jgi:hypothetical protein